MAGGRMRFKKNQVVRILTLDGKISVEKYTIKTEVADGRGHVQLEKYGGQRIIKVNQRRIIPQPVNKKKAIVVESGNKYRAVCPDCPTVFDITPDHTRIECPDHGISTLYWLGDKPVTNTTTTSAVNTAPKPTTAKPSTTKKDKKPRMPIAVDLNALAKLAGCELWTKTNVAFNHAKIVVQTHALLFVDGDPRKLCWNTYDSTLGKKGKPLPIDEFLAGGDSPAWYSIKNLDRERAKLADKGYERQS